MVDTGAEVCVTPATAYERRHNTKGRPLTAANSSKINTYGTRKVRLQLCGRIYEWNFYIADVERPLLGADFL